MVLRMDFKTSYVDIKLQRIQESYERNIISKHHMLILNCREKNHFNCYISISKHHMLILNRVGISN